jgi:hypothetical protein
MRHDSEVAELPAAGAPEGKSEIEITPAMVEAGAEAVYAFVGEVVAYGSETLKEAAREVFLAMARAK